MLGSAVLVLSLVMALVLRAMHTRLMEFFSGDSTILVVTLIWWPLRFLERRRAQDLLTRANAHTEWEGEPARLRSRLAIIPNVPGRPPGHADVAPLLADATAAALDAIGGVWVSHQTYVDLANRLAALYVVVADAALSPIVLQVMTLAETMELMAQYPSISALALYYEQFGPRGVLQPTRLGNRMRAIEIYPYRRYEMDGAVFWPHIEALADETLRDDIADQRTQLEMVLATTAVFLVLSLATALCGPWVGLSFKLSVVAAIAFAVLSWLFYEASLRVATALGTALCVACDTTRHEILQKMGLRLPANLNEEKSQWREASRLVAFGQGNPTFA
jgi:hypothetical protein